MDIDIGSFLRASTAPERTQRRLHQSFFKSLESKLLKSAFLKPNYIINETQDDYVSEKLSIPLYSGSKSTLLDSLFRHFVNFSSNNGMSKSALSMCLRNEKKVLPSPNCLPESYREAHQLIKPLLVPTTKYDACVNDCLLYRVTADEDFSLDRECRKCGETRYKAADTLIPRKSFSYMPIGPRLARMYGCKNICQLLNSRPDISNGKLMDVTDGNVYKSWYKEGGVFQGMDEANTVPLALFCDGLNPHKSMATQKSMWPLLLTWINLPVAVRNVLGPMMLVGIVPGTRTEEPKNLDPYLDVLVDELLDLSECTLYDAYKGAPTTVKVALLQFLCDIPAFSKILHVSSQAALRGCPYCKEEGCYCKSLHKVIHIKNRTFLPSEHHLRQEKSAFALKGEEAGQKPKSYTREEEAEIRKEYDSLPNQNRKSILQRQTGLKGTYSFMRLEYHDRRQQMQPDGMHTIADVIGNVLDLVTGKDDSKKVRDGEEQYDRFKETWHKKRTLESENPESGTSCKKPRLDKAEVDELPAAPWRLDKPGLKVADQRATSLSYPCGFDYQPDKHFTKPWTLRTMHGKHQFVKSGAALWCLRGLLPKQQETTLDKLFKVIEYLTRESYCVEELDHIVKLTSETMCLLERDFPLTLQTITTHLMHHIPEGFSDFGPLYGRWLFPFERVNSWITRQALNRNQIESTIMETYAIYDWCVYMVMSGKVKDEDVDVGKLQRLIIDNQENTKASCSEGNAKKFKIPEDILLEMSDIYDFCLVSRMDKEGIELKSFNRTQGQTGRTIKLSPHSSTKSCNCYVYLLNCDPTDDLKFGKINKIYEHTWRGKLNVWVLLDMFGNTRCDNGFWNVADYQVQQRVVRIEDISDPQIVGRENGRLFFITNSV